MSCETRLISINFTLFSYHLLFSLLEFSFPINKIDFNVNFSKEKKGEWKFLKKRNSSFFGKKWAKILFASF